MKLPRLVAPLLILALSGCAGPRLPWQHEDPTLDPIHAAYQTLLGSYVDPPSSSALLGAAYDGSRQALAAAGVRDSELPQPSWGDSQADNWDRFAQAYSQMTDKYGKQVGANKLEYGAINAMAASLKDCQTRFFDPGAMKDRQAEASSQQQFGGIGVLMKNIPGHPTVLRVLDGPARSSGLKPGDEIVAVDGKPTTGKTFEQVRDEIRGPQGSTVKITIKRPGDGSTLDFEVGRAQIQAPIIDAAILGQNVGYIHLYSFPQGITDEIDKALTVFDQRKIGAIVIDVRANTGGDQQTILQVLSRFVKGGTAEVQIERGGQRQAFTLDPSAYWKTPRPVVVLADEDTQSGGEVFAKAMQEEGGFKVVGAPTAGCAASAHLFQLSDGSGLDVSIGKLMSGRGAEINRVGVKPDYAVPYPVDDLAAGHDTQLAGAVEALQVASGPAPAGGNPPAQAGGATPILKPVGPSGGAPLPVIK